MPNEQNPAPMATQIEVLEQGLEIASRCQCHRCGTAERPMIICHDGMRRCPSCLGAAALQDPDGSAARDLLVLTGSSSPRSDYQIITIPTGQTEEEAMAADGLLIEFEVQVQPPDWTDADLKRAEQSDGE